MLSIQSIPYSLLTHFTNSLSFSGCSPSPCGSIASDLPQLQDVSPAQATTEPSKTISDNLSPTQNVTELSATTADVIHLPIDFEDDDPSKKHLKEYLHSFDRRNSDSSCLPNHPTSASTCEKLNLADEIKKLSERLMILSSINTDLTEYNEKVTNGVKTEEKTSEPIRKIDKDATVVNKKKPSKTEDSEKSKLDSHKSKYSDRFSRSYSTTNDLSETSSTSKFSRFTRASSVVSSSSTSSYNKTMTNGLSERLKSLDETPNLMQRLGNTRGSSVVPTSLRNGSAKTITTTSAKSSYYNGNNSYTSSIGSAPWPVSNKRTKFRVSQLSRDVPIGSPYTHQTVFLEEAVTTTKDCLLHLLEKYNESDTRAAYSNQGRHQSIAVGYGISDNLEYRSMNSLNHFFQRHASAGNTVKQIQARIESKRKS